MTVTHVIRESQRLQHHLTLIKDLLHVIALLLINLARQRLELLIIICHLLGDLSA